MRSPARLIVVAAMVTTWSAAASTATLEQRGAELWGSVPGEASVRLCGRITLRQDLVACYEGCGTERVQLRETTDYAQLWAGVLGKAFSSKWEMRYSTEALQMVRSGKGWDIVPTQDEVDPFPPLGPCDVRFDGEACAIQVGEAILAQRGGFDRYIEALSTLAASEDLKTCAAPDQYAQLETLIRLAKSVRDRLLARRCDRFDEYGAYVAANFRNAPGLICQLRSRLEGSRRQACAAADRRIQDALTESIQELRWGLAFLSR